jgi:hypothetical protein
MRVVLSVGMLVMVLAASTECGGFNSQEAVLKSAHEEEHLSEECILKWIDANWWNAVEYKLKAAIDSGVEISEMVYFKAVTKVHKIDRVIETLEAETSEQILEPAFRWAQSATNVYLDVKFSHRFDSPGCNDITDEGVEFEDDKLKLTGSCTISNTKFRAALNLKFYNTIDVEASTWEKKNGKIYVEIAKKKAPRAWPRLLKAKKKPKNMSIWWDMSEKYSNEISKLEE